ncbi:MAG: FAD-dependent oxidoreductase [Gemmatimonadales bacterium]|jgi:NADPH-dependent 2,4-dienoyl-CoA reductase/sulfur reductase-like enzyme/nitrite reductase/ring-hydroxylating ferredoxin subunit
MSGEQEALKGPDLAAGVPSSTVPDGGMLLGHAQGKAVLVARRGTELFALSATCTHYSGPLGEGLIVDETVRCPWHHACFSLRTGEALRAPALNPVSCWEVSRKGDTIVVGRELAAHDGATPVAGRARTDSTVQTVVIVGAGAAGNAAAEMLRRDGFTGAITMIGADPSGPYDRPNLSKDYLAGSAPEEWLPLRGTEFYEKHKIELLTSMRVTAIDAKAKKATLENGQSRTFDRLLLATGATPIVLKIPGAERPQVHYLRTLADSRAIIAAAENAHRAVVIGASFIGLEVAASLRTRGLEVHVVAPDTVPLVKVFGPELGAHIKAIHDQHGVKFSLGRSVIGIGADDVTLDDGQTITADLVVIGIGVRPNLDLAKDAGLAVDNGVTVNEYLETSVPGIYAAGDIASFPYRSGGNIRVEHFVVAERQGQTAARNILGLREKFDAIPFFWSAHYDTSVSYVGHASKWEEIVVGGDIAKGDATVAYRENGKAVAFATLGRDHASLEAERGLELDDASALKRLTTK